jgi:flagellar motor switch protein FliG
MPVITIPKILREKLTEEGAEALVDIINKADERQKEDIIRFVEEKFERRLADAKSEIIKWMFIFIFGQFWAIVGVLFVFFNK